MLNLNTPINSLGYGVVGYNIWDTITSKMDVSLYPIGGRVELPCDIDEQTELLLKQDLDRANRLEVDSPCLKIWHENQLHERIGRGKYFAFPFFEINKFDERRKTHLNSTDHLFVASEWAAGVCLENEVTTPITIAPCGVDRRIFNENICQISHINRDRCIFFNCGKWEVRKGHDILGRAFNDAFQNNNDVELWMMNENPFLSPQERQLWENKYNSYNIKLINRVRTQQELANIIGKTFCGVFPARAEGWNLELLEMMSMGKHVIATNYSAHTEFCNEENCKLIDASQLEPAYDGKWFIGDVGSWFKFDQDAYDQLVNHLRKVYNTWKENPEQVNNAGVETATNFSWDKTVDIIMKEV